MILLQQAYTGTEPEPRTPGSMLILVSENNILVNNTTVTF